MCRRIYLTYDHLTAVHSRRRTDLYVTDRAAQRRYGKGRQTPASLSLVRLPFTRTGEWDTQQVPPLTAS
jgi:hypothetical protein